MEEAVAGPTEPVSVPIVEVSMPAAETFDKVVGPSGEVLIVATEVVDEGVAPVVEFSPLWLQKRAGCPQMRMQVLPHFSQYLIFSCKSFDELSFFVSLCKLS